MKTLLNQMQRKCITRMLMIFSFLCFLLTTNIKLFSQESGILTGSVTDVQTGEPLAGATIVVIGTTYGTTADFDGKFVLDLSTFNSPSLMFSFIGYESKTVNVEGGIHTMNVQLNQQQELLDELVVIGYGTTKKSDLTGSLSSVSAEDFEKEPVTSFSQVLKGRSAGVVVTENNGAPGSEAKIRIRGINSINGNNSPLFIIDGISGDISSINVNDISSIEVLKDASATAIYGNRGSNGVVIVTTKQGKAGTSKVQFESFVGIDEIPDNRLFDIMDGADYMHMVNVHKGEVYFTAQEIDSVRSRNLGTDWQRAQIKTGITQSYQLGISGGSKNTQFYISGRFIDQQGTVINSGYEKFNLRTNINHTINDKVSINLTTNILNDKKHNVNLQGLLFESLVWSPNLPFDAKEDLIGRSIGANQPVLSIENLQDDIKSQGININFNAQINLFKGLTLTPRVGINKRSANSKKFTGQYAEGMKSSISISDYESVHFENSNILTYFKEIEGHSELTITAVNEWIKSNSYNYNVSEDEIDDDSFGYYRLGLGAKQNLPTSVVSEFALLSYLGRVNYVLLDKYLFTSSMRADGSSRFKGKNKWGYFPSAAFAWKISKEHFMKSVAVVNDFKLRTSYGVVGNSSVSAYATMGTLAQEPTVTSYPYFGESVLFHGYTLGSPPNSDLRWEEQEQFNVGFDISLWQNKLTVSIDYFNKNTNGLLLEKPLPLFQSQGFPGAGYWGRYGISGSYWTNAGKVNNQGFEFNIDYTPLSHKDFFWKININGSHYSNDIVDLGGLDEIQMSDTWGISTHRAALNKPIGSFFLYDYIGVWKEEEVETAALYNAKPGQPKYLDANMDSLIDENDIVYVGNSNPDFVWGFSQDFTYKNFSLNVFINGSHGAKAYNLNYAFTMSQHLLSSTATHVDALNYYDPITNPNSNVPNTIQGERFNSTRFFQDASFIKIKNISLSYNIPKEKLPWIDLNLYASFKNLYTFSKYKGYDPELSSTGSSDNKAGFDMSSYPIPRTFTIGLKASF